MKNNNQISSCLITNTPVVPILDLGMHPYADTFVGPDQQHLSEPVLPLRCNLSKDSGLIQLDCVSNDWDRYNLYSYSYTSSNSSYSRGHWDEMAEALKHRIDLRDKLVVEIGCNDGYLLKQFKASSRVLGVDASSDMCGVLQNQNLPFYRDIFSTSTSAQIKWINGSAGLVIANNVLNHANNPVDFVEGVRDLLAPEGWFVFEVPSWSWMMAQNRWDMIYHEHVSYFTMTSLIKLLERADLRIHHVDLVDYHGESFRVWARHADRVVVVPESVQDIAQQEQTQGLFCEDFYAGIAENMKQQRHKNLSQLLQYKIQEPQRPIIGIGAAAKANTWLNYHGINHLLMDYVTDSSPQKQNKYTPLSRIPIVDDEIFAQYESPRALVLSWNISNKLRDAILSINARTEFINL
jgi:SAM-dependent methyltransferase